MPAQAKKRKVAVMGFRAVGKSSLSIRFVEGDYVENYEPTIENTYSKQLNMRNQPYDLELIDTAGQDEFSALPQSYFLNIDGYVLVYSVNSEKSFEVCSAIYDKLLDYTGKRALPVVLVGNKSDLELERVVQSDRGRKLAEQIGAVFLETSAKEDKRVCEVFQKMIERIELAEGVKPPQSSCCLQ